MTDQLLIHHIAETRDKVIELKEQLNSLQEKIDDLRDFKTSLIVTSRLTSLIVSAVCGFITFVATIWVSLK